MSYALTGLDIEEIAEHQRLRAELSRLRQQLEVARKALEPFGNIYEELVEDDVIKPKETERMITIFTNVFDLRAATTAYDKIKGVK